MALYGRSNRVFVESDLLSGSIMDSQIVNCDLDGLRAVGSHWERANMADLNASGASFSGCAFSSSAFERVNMQGASFTGCAFSGMTLSGLTLIKSSWADVTLSRSAIKNSCLQRASLYRVRAVGSSFADFEAISARVDRCVFVGCAFELDYGNGMNGFSGAVISNALFCDCRFEGFPFRGARIENSAFVRCRGDVGDDMECVNVAGLPAHARAEPRKLANRSGAEELLRRFGFMEAS